MSKTALLLGAIALLVAGSLGLRTLGDPSATAAERPSGANVRTARGLTISIRLTDYATHQALDCGGTYTISSWVAAKVEATANRAGTASLVYMTNENHAKYWHAKSFSTYLRRGYQVIGRTDQWPDPSGDTDTYTFIAQLYKTGHKRAPEASTRCTVTVSKS